MREERAKVHEGTNSMERAKLLERTKDNERAIGQESTIRGERARSKKRTKHPERTWFDVWQCRRIAADLRKHRKQRKLMQAVGAIVRESTSPKERAREGRENQPD